MFSSVQEPLMLIGYVFSSLWLCYTACLFHDGALLNFFSILLFVSFPFSGFGWDRVWNRALWRCFFSLFFFFFVVVVVVVFFWFGGGGVCCGAVRATGMVSRWNYGSAQRMFGYLFFS